MLGSNEYFNKYNMFSIFSSLSSKLIFMILRIIPWIAIILTNCVFDIVRNLSYIVIPTIFVFSRPGQARFDLFSEAKQKTFVQHRHSAKKEMQNKQI